MAEKKKKKKNNEANWMVSNSAKLNSRTKQHTQSGVSTSNGSRDIAATKSWRKKNKKKEKKIKKNEHRRNYIASPTGIANNVRGGKNGTAFWHYIVGDGLDAKGLPSVWNVYVDTLCLYTHSYD